MGVGGEISVREELGHLRDEFIEKFVGFFAGGIHRGIENSPFALDRVWARATGEFGIADEPRSAMAGHIKFGNDPDAAVARVDDEVAKLFLWLVQAVEADFVQLWN